MAKKQKSILVIGAHNDDQIIGAGGTLAKYAKEGKPVHTVIFCYGELSHPHLKEEVIRKKRVKESRKSDKILGGSGIRYLGLREPDFMKSLKQKKEKEKIKKALRVIIKNTDPEKVFTHSDDDPHGMHRKVNEIVMEIVKEDKADFEVYSFDIWNLLKFKNRNAPKLVVDVTKTFNRKIRAFKAHKSQKMTMITLMWNVYLKAIIHGFAHGCRYAEVFRRLN